MIPKSIFVACPVRSGVQPETVHTIASLPMLFHEMGIAGHLQCEKGGSFLPHVRNKIADDYRASEMDAILMMDDDVAVTDGTIRRMIEADVDYVGIAFPKRENEFSREEAEPAIELLHPIRTQNHTGIELLGVDRVGVALTLIKREVFDLVSKRSLLRAHSRLPGPGAPWHEPRFTGYFDSIEGKSEDLSFSERCYAADVRQYFLPDVDAWHAGRTLNLAEWLARQVGSKP